MVNATGDTCSAMIVSRLVEGKDWFEKAETLQRKYYNWSPLTSEIDAGAHFKGVPAFFICCISSMYKHSSQFKYHTTVETESFLL